MLELRRTAFLFGGTFIKVGRMLVRGGESSRLLYAWLMLSGEGNFRGVAKLLSSSVDSEGLGHSNNLKDDGKADRRSFGPENDGRSIGLADGGHSASTGDECSELIGDEGSLIA